MKTIEHLLAEKGGEVWSLGPQATVYEAIELMAEKAIGALLVLEEGKPIGIISERDYARKVILKGRSSKDTAIRDIMSAPVIHTDPQCSIETCMSLMTTNKIRHLPVMAGDELSGMVSIGDLVKATISEQKSTIEYLERYISG